MSKYIIDWCPKYKCGLIKSENIDVLRTELSIADPTSKAKARARNRRYSAERLYAITNTGRFQPGLVYDILAAIKVCDHDPTVIITKPFKDKFSVGYPFVDQALPVLSRELRYYQRDAVQACLQQGRGLVVVGTAGGKTLMMATLTQAIIQNTPQARILVILPPELVSQTYNDYLEYGIHPNTIAKWDGSNRDNKTGEPKKAPVTFASMKMITSNKALTLKLFKNCDCVIVDEVHKIKKKNQITKIAQKFETQHRFGFTGTLPDDQIDEWHVRGVFGKVVFEKPSHELREEGYISQAHVKIIEVTYDTQPNYIDFSSLPPGATFKPAENYHRELEFILHNQKRNTIIERICNKVDNNILVLVDRIEHGEILEKVIRDNGTKKVYFIQGAVDQFDRERVKQLMEEQDDIVCIAMSKIFSTGISINNIHFILFAGGGRAKTKIVQSIGRGLRLHPQKITLVIYDIVDRLTYGLRHHSDRLKLYEQEKLDYYVRTI